MENLLLCTLCQTTISNASSIDASFSPTREHANSDCNEEIKDEFTHEEKYCEIFSHYIERQFNPQNFSKLMIKIMKDNTIEKLCLNLLKKSCNYSSQLANEFREGDNNYVTNTRNQSLSTLMIKIEKNHKIDQLCNDLVNNNEDKGYVFNT